MTNLIIILGAPVDNNGNISLMGKGRLDLGFEKLSKLKTGNENWKILLTGGFGEHFNQTNKPYAEYAKNYLISKGLKDEDFIEFGLSVNTVDDARQAYPIVIKYSPKKIIVISSDFHIGNDNDSGRVRFIFERFFKNEDIKIEYLGAKYLDTLPEEDQRTILAHEARELESLKTRGVSIVAGEIALPKA